ncbi:MAG TPA: hypothetical protein VFK50_07275 [Sphingomicrobium sp.]|nr:hypothetical protein [Sphingomicrobium sp.]
MTRTLILSQFLLTAACGDATAPGNDATLVANEVIVETETAATDEATPPLAEVNGADPAAPEPAPIPAKFRGTWAESKTACTNLNHPSRLTISGRSVRFRDFVIFGDSVTASGNQFALKGKIEGSNRAAEAHYFLDPTGNELTDGAGGGAVRVRCA